MAKKPAKSGKKAKAKKDDGKKAGKKVKKEKAAKGKKAKAAPAKKAAKKSAKKAPKKAKKASKKAKSAKSSGKPNKVAFGSITHTDFASHDPGAMKTWATKVLGWSFKPAFAMPDGGEYEMFSYSEQGGGGISHITPSETAASVPYIHVANCQDAFDRSVSHGAESIMSPSEVMPGMKLAIVRAPGGATIGLSGP